MCTTSHAFTAGKDGTATIAAANQVVNLYTTAPSGGTAGSSTLSVASTAGITAGDLVLVYQAQGATINTTNTNAYGSITNYNSAGRYEFQSVQSVAAGTLTFDCGLRYTYAAGRTQVIRVPLYSALTVNGGASIAAQAWNGSTGGVAAVHVQGTATINGSIHANGLGFRGGAARNNTGVVDNANAVFVTTNVNLGAEKGEGIAGSQADYDSLGGRVGRGAPANGGGGGDLHNGGGGGGANGNNGNNWLTSGGTVGGQGVMCAGCTGNSAWTLDPGYAANGNSLTNSAGGGRGGYTYASTNQNALTVAPGNSIWGGDYRREVGGLGGRPLDNDPGNLTTPRLFMGGGGGAGDQNNSVGGSGGNGGGIVLVAAGSISGSGTLQANGNAGANTTGANNDAPGGGGGGGSIVTLTSSLAGPTLSALGGGGGNQNAIGPESEGPGGGGGGGFIAASLGGTITGGVNGTTISTALTEFPANGATSGGSGQSLGPLASYPQCVVITLGLGGRVYEDTNYGGGAGRSQAASGGVAVANARVELFNSGGAFVTSTTTNASGDYSFAGLAAANYTVRVVNSSVRSTRTGGAACAACLPVQTWRTDATSGTAVAVTDRVGGESPQLIDAVNGSTTLAALTTATATAQSITAVTLGASSITGLDFGYNFDTIVNPTNTGQGSLRQFITNANALGGDGSLMQAGYRTDLVTGSTVALTGGVESTIFMITDGAAHAGLRAGLSSQLTSGRALIGIASLLPQLSTPMNIEGGTQTYNVGNTNNVTLGTGGTVGTAATSLPQINGPEVELRDGLTGNDGWTLGFDVTAADVTLRGMAIGGFGGTSDSNTNGNILFRNAAANGRIEGNVIGATALAFSSPGYATPAGDNIRVDGAETGTILNNLIGFSDGNGIGTDSSSSSDWLIQGNEVRGNSAAGVGNAGIELADFRTGTIRNNLITANPGGGIVIEDATGNGNAITQNTITSNGTGGTTRAGILIQDANNNTISYNIIASNGNAGIVMEQGATGNRITQNSTYNNGGLGIDLTNINTATQGDGVTLNDSGDGDSGGNNRMNFPVLDTATCTSGGTLVISGWARPGSVVEFFVRDNDATGFGEGQTYLATATEGSGVDTNATTSTYGPGNVNGLAQGTDNTNRFTFTLTGLSGLGSSPQITATATDGSNNTSEFSGRYALSCTGPSLVFLKTVAVYSDPVNATTNPKNIPGAVVEYTILVTNTGSGQADNGVVTDPIPVNLTYSPGSISVDGVAQSDAADADSAQFGANTVTATLGTIAAGASRTIRFRATLN